MQAHLLELLWAISVRSLHACKCSLPIPQLGLSPVQTDTQVAVADSPTTVFVFFRG